MVLLYYCLYYQLDREGEEYRLTELTIVIIMFYVSDGSLNMAAFDLREINR